MGTVNVLEAARAFGIKRVVVSSSNVLAHYLHGGEGGGDLMQEEAFPRPTTFYSATKQAVESLGLNYARWCGVDFAAMRYGAVFGPWSGAGGGGPSNIVREALRGARRRGGESAGAARRSGSIPRMRRAAPCWRLNAKDLGTRMFNITMGSVTARQRFGRGDHQGRAGRQAQDRDAAGRAPFPLPTLPTPVISSKARSILGYEPQFKLEAALADMVAWMVKAAVPLMPTAAAAASRCPTGSSRVRACGRPCPRRASIVVLIGPSGASVANTMWSAPKNS